MALIGYVECGECGSFTYFSRPEDLTIWFHPDDPKPLCEAVCKGCGVTVWARIDYDHMANFKRYGCKITNLSERFEPLTDEAIDEWDIDSEIGSELK